MEVTAAIIGSPGPEANMNVCQTSQVEFQRNHLDATEVHIFRLY
jgi:hypothetical protein